MSHPKSHLKSLNANARKSLSQNFLSSPHWAEKLVMEVTKAEEVDAYWEVGPGLGALTERLVSKVKAPVTVFEFDRKLSADLRERFPKVTVVEGDFLKADLGPLFPTGKVNLLSNTPYHLSSPLLFKLLDFRNHWNRIVLTFQKEFADRLIALPHTTAYGGPSVIFQTAFSMASLGIIPPGAFYPPPSVFSQAVLLKPLDIESAYLDSLRKVVRAAFSHRRKKLTSNLNEVFPKALVESAVTELKISPNARAEELTKETYQDLTKRLI